MKVLIIEDEKLLADSIQSVLERKGFEVECVYDGETGAEYAELGIYDLLILDVMMPKMNGCQVAREVRAKRCGTPILMLTARSELEDRIEGLNAGADYYLTKPFKASDDVRMMDQGGLHQCPAPTAGAPGGSGDPGKYRSGSGSLHPDLRRKAGPALCPRI